jgi:hypothetical protein
MTTPVLPTKSFPSASMSIDTVSHGRISQSSNDTELTTSSRPDQFLVSDCRVVDHRCEFNIIVSTKFGLESGAESPALSFAFLIDSHTMIRISCNLCGIDIGDLSWNSENSWISSRVTNNLVLRQIRDLQSKLVAIQSTPNQ